MANLTTQEAWKILAGVTTGDEQAALAQLAADFPEGIKAYIDDAVEE